MEIRLLGPVEVREGERVVALPRRQQRALLAALALRAGEVVSTDRLVADLWGDRAPASAHGSLQNTVLALRKALGRDVLLTQAPGYRLAVEPDRVDAHRFEKQLVKAIDSEPARRVALLGEALALWHGPALAGLDEEGFARLEADRLDELRVVALEERIEAELELGRHAALVGELETLVATHPLRERLRAQLMLALYRCGRQAEALEVYRAARLALADELGLDPSPGLQELERRILRQDPGLAAPVEAQHEVSPPPAERRLVTVLAAIPPVADDPETLRRRLDELLARVRGVLDRNDGALERFGPEGLVAVFGGEAPQDDDAARAVRSAAEIGLPAGIATGESVGGAGAVFRRAAELAREGGLQLDERTRALLQEGRRLDTPLVGRTEELTRLHAAFHATEAERRCRVVTVLGEPGIGKTRLGRELTSALAAEATVLVGRCFSYGRGQTFLPLLDALQELDLAAALTDDPQRELTETRLAALAGAQDAGSLGESYWALRRLLELLGQTKPVLLLLDDVHWAEPALLDLVDYLAERVTSTPLLIISLARPELERPAGELLPLGPLTPDEARELVTSLADLDADTRERVVALADGNALYAEQLAAYAEENESGLPPTLEAVLAGRIGRLADPERHVLQRAAVAGREFTRGVVAALSDEPVDTALSSLSRRSFVHPATTTEPGDDGYRFHHVLLRDAAYATLTKAQRADLHERAAGWLDRDGPGDDALAGYHLEQSVRSRRELGEDADELAARAGERLGRAGMQAWQVVDTSAAVGLLTRAIDLLPVGRRRAELLWELSLALSNLAGGEERATAALARAADEAAALGDRALEARAAAETARNLWWAGELPLAEAAETISTCVRTLERHADQRGLGRALLDLAGVHLFAGKFGEIEDAMERAAAHYVAAGMTPAACLGLRAEALYYGATPVADAERRCVALLEQSVDDQTKANVSAVLGGLRALGGAIEAGRDLLEQARRSFEDLNTRLSLSAVVAPLAMDLEICAGDREAAERIGRSSFSALSHHQDRAFAATRAVQLGDLLLDADKPRDAETFVAYAEANMIDGDVLVQFLALSERARLLARDGAAEQAEELARSAIAIAAHTEMLRDRARAGFALAEVLALSGRKREARREHDRATRLLQVKGAHALVAARARNRRGELEELPSRAAS